MVSIQIRGLEKRFGDVVALNQLDLDIQSGELFFLLGPSGCGKTTLLRSIAGFHLPDSGTIEFDQEDVTRIPPHLRETAMMFQSYALWPHLNVYRNVAFGLEERKVSKAETKERVEEALAMVKMEGLGNRKINQLSGGQQQRVALARALVVRPRCLMLDEPLSNLDAKLRIEMRSEIRRICKESGLTAIYVTHDQKEALSIADRLAILDGGNIAQVGTPEDVYRRPRSALVAGFIGETNLIKGEVAFISGANVYVKTAIGDLAGRPSDPDYPLEPGTPVTLSIRPECLSIETTPPARNEIAGHLTESIYLGEVAQYSLQAPGREEPFHISELNPRRIIRDTKQKLYASSKPEDVMILPFS
ncbi:MAG: ABC transporter ATP-binding protein [Verrucomicrobiales bacterium]|nr:ABC transporter ATP-binding protein [Verrucomicrobiales bacterium]